MVLYGSVYVCVGVSGTETGMLMGYEPLPDDDVG